MDARFYGSKLAAWDPLVGNEKLLQAITRYVDHWPTMQSESIGLLIHGSPGIGKSFAAFALANELIMRYETVAIAVSSIGLLNRLRDTYGYKGAAAENIIKRLENASLLVLDDLGAEQKTEWATTALYEIIDSRYRGGKPMVVTTNLSLEQLQAKLSAGDGVSRTYDRLVEMCLPVKVNGPSQRAAVAKKKREQLVQLLKGDD